MRANKLGGLALLTGLALGCGRTSVGDFGAGNGPGGDAGAHGGGGAALGGGGAALGGDGPVVGGQSPAGGAPSVQLGPATGLPPGTGMPGPALKPGTCGVLRAIPLPNQPEARSAVVTRQAGGFAMGPWKSGDLGDAINGVFIDNAGRGRNDLGAYGGLNDIAWSVLMAERHLDVEVYVAPGDAPLVDHFNTRFWAPFNHAPTERGTLLSASWRGTDQVLVQPSLDGKNAVFAIWPLAIAEPQAALIGTDGARVGMAHALAPSDHRLGECPLLVPTAHGGIISYVDPDERALRLFQLEADGSLSLDLHLPLPVDNHACPVFSVDDAGPSFLLDRAPPGQPSSFRLAHVVVGGGAGEAPIALAGPPIAWTTTSAGVLVLERASGGYSLELQTPTGPQVFALPNVGSELRPLYSEPGHIYVDSGAFDEPRNLLELTCR